MRRVAITGLGAVTAVGVGGKAFWQGLRDGRSGIGPIRTFDTRAYDCKVAGEILDFQARDFMSGKAAATHARFTQLGVAAARMAFDEAGLASISRARVGVCFGTSTSAVREFQDAVEQQAKVGALPSPSDVLESIGAALTNHVAVALELMGPTMTLGSGCASGLDVVQWGCEEIRAGRVDAIVGGASDSPLSSAIHATWSSLGLLSRWPGPPAQALRPFDAMGDGTVLGEAAGAFVLEDFDHARNRGAQIHAEILGYGAGNEGLHRRGADDTVVSLRTAIVRALRAARLDPRAIDYISTHGGGVPPNDRAETATYREAFGRHVYSIPVTSIKPATGNPFSAGGALQIVAGCYTIDDQFVPPTVNLEIPHPECDLDYVPNQGRVVRVNHVLVAARAIGPTYSAIVLARPSAD